MKAFLIKNGTVYHPERHGFCRENIAVEDDKLATVTEGREYTVIDAEGCIVTPGLIDYHVHYFNRGTENGVNRCSVVSLRYYDGVGWGKLWSRSL